MLYFCIAFQARLFAALAERSFSVIHLNFQGMFFQKNICKRQENCISICMPPGSFALGSTSSLELYCKPLETG